MYELIEAGGWILLPIGLCSLIALAVFLERLWSLRRPRVLPNAFVHRIEALIKDKKHHDAQVLCSEYPLPAARIYATGLKHANLERSQLREPVEEAGRQEAQKLERHIELIGTCAAISPLLGLLGTVVGMMAVFRDVEVSGLGDPSQFANGIWQSFDYHRRWPRSRDSLVCFYKLLLSKVDSLILELEEMSSRLIDLLVETRS